MAGELACGAMAVDRLAEWLELIAACYAPDTAASWDSVGLQVGDPDAAVTTAMTSLDVTAEVLAEARDRSVDLVISHHPLLFRPLERNSSGWWEMTRSTTTRCCSARSSG